MEYSIYLTNTFEVLLFVLYIIINCAECAIDSRHHPLNPPTSTPRPKNDDVSWVHWYQLGIVPKRRILPHHALPLHFGESVFGGSRRSSTNGNKTEQSDVPGHLTVLIFFGVLLVGFLLGFSLHCIKRRQRRSENAVIIKGDTTEPRPKWTKDPSVVLERSDFGWDRNQLGSHIVYVNQKTINFCCPVQESHYISGALYNESFYNGKHIFACMWPRVCKAYDCQITVGFGLPQHIELTSDWQKYLVGGSRTTMGLDLIRNCLVNKGHSIEKYPRNKTSDFCIPTLFYIYLDLDIGKLYFGSETEFWGCAFDFSQNLRDMLPIYPMVAAHGAQGKFMIFYKGQVIETLQSEQGFDNAAFEMNEEDQEKPSTSYVQNNTSKPTETYKPLPLLASVMTKKEYQETVIQKFSNATTPKTSDSNLPVQQGSLKHQDIVVSYSVKQEQAEEKTTQCGEIKTNLENSEDGCHIDIRL